jgi:hypothetical protein
MAIEINDKEMQAIKALEAELIAAQTLELGIRSDNGLIQGIVDESAMVASFYSNPKKVQALIDELNLALKKYVEKAGKEGRLMAEKTLEKYLTESERVTRTQRMTRIIGQMNERQAKKRLELYVTQMTNEGKVLQGRIKEFVQLGKVAGRDDKTILKELVKAAQDKEGIAQGFVKRFQSQAAAAARRERSFAEIAEYRKNVPVEAKWQWITVSSKPCPDCEARAGVVLTYPRWVEMGLPGAGRTVCTQYCLCKLIPFSIAEEQFPNVKVFDWDSKTTVLATASEERVLKAKSNQGRNSK